MSWPSAAISSIAIVCTLLAGCSRTQARREPEPTADVRLYLNALGLPKDFFSSREELLRRIIGYRFVVWLNRDEVVVGFNTSPNNRVVHDRLVDGAARLLIFGVDGSRKVKRDIPYLADGNGELVADGEAMPGPGGTLLFRIDSVNLDKEGRKESPSGVLLHDANLGMSQELIAFWSRQLLSGTLWYFRKALYLVNRGPTTSWMAPLLHR